MPGVGSRRPQDREGQARRPEQLLAAVVGAHDADRRVRGGEVDRLLDDATVRGLG
jgi:hypothetical protein